ncbi:MAG: O-antigen ligase family protein [Geminicoccaceae bacterium]|nr:O-antigen ligase family protein [Geminicoccaceae bacterium]
MMIRLLFILATAFLFVSSSTAALYDLQSWRMFGFSMVFMALIAAAVAARPRFRRCEQDLPVVLFWLVSIMAFMDMDGSFDPLDYKILLPILAIAAAPSLRHVMIGVDLRRLIYVLLALHTLVLTILHAGDLTSADDDTLSSRLDLTGSVVAQASLGTITFMLAAGEARAKRGLPRTADMGIATLALLQVMLSGTRTAIMTLLVMAALSIIAGPDRHRQIRIVLGAALVLTLAFGLHTLFISDTYFLRLTGAYDDDYSSGRLHSLAYWLTLAGDTPLGHGIGTVRDIMQDGRPWIADGRLLEWPHNEFVRFHVEAGFPGLALVVLLIGGMTRRALHKAARTTDPRERAFVLLLTADMIAQSLLQNHFNMIYNSTMMMLVLAMLCVDPDTPRPIRSRLVVSPDHDKNQLGSSACRAGPNLPSMT